MIACVANRNPFATRHVRPGKLPYVFAEGESAEAILARWRSAGRRGAIIGPHGTGKSTLLAALFAALIDENPQLASNISSIVLHDGERRLPTHFSYPSHDEPRGVVVIDGYEQLGWWARQKLRRKVRRCGWGLLVTAHAECGLPVIYRTEGNLAVVKQLVARLLQTDGSGLVQDEDIRAAFQAENGNVRETLFALYDLWELRRRPTPDGNFLPTSSASL